MIAESKVPIFNNVDDQSHTRNDFDCWVSRALIMATEEHRTNKRFTLLHLPLFRLATSLGFKKLAYKTSDNRIDEEHAAHIGQALSGKQLDFFALELTNVATSECWETLANQAAGASVNELCISHKGGYKEIPETCEALAYLCTKLKVHTIHLSAEFEDGSIDAFVRCLRELGNQTLQAATMNDTSLSPHFEIRHLKLIEFVHCNRD